MKKSDTGARASNRNDAIGSAVLNATIDGSSGADTVDGRSGESNVLSGLGGDDLVRGADRPDFLFGGAGDDTLIGNRNDAADGATDGDFLQGDAGDDVFLLGGGDDVIHGFAPAGSGSPGIDDGFDLIDASGLAFPGAGSSDGGIVVTFDGAGSGTILHGGNVETASFSATFTGIDGIVATRLADSIEGGAGEETISAGAGNDTISAGAGGGRFDGGSGDDSIIAGSGAAVYLGGEGRDILSGEALDGAVTVTLDGAGRGKITSGGVESGFSGFETIVGSSQNDTILGSAAEDTIDGGAGDDVLSGGEGVDTVRFDTRAVDAQFFLTEDGDYRVVTSAMGDDLVTDFEVFEFTDTRLTLADVALIAETGPSGGSGDDPGRGDDDTDDLPDETSSAPVSATAPVGNGIDSRADRSIVDALFGGELEPTSIRYSGSPDAIGLLPQGYEITDGETSVYIERGIFLSSGGGPGTENTENGFTVDHGEPGDSRLTETAANAFPEAGGTSDAAIVSFTFDGSQLATDTLALDLFFGSDEYPEYADSAFVDIAAVYVNGVNYALFGNDPRQPLAIVGDSINTEGNFFDNTDGRFNTEYDGFSTLLTVLAPIVAGQNEVVIAIADTGDAILDSGIFVGDAEASTFAGAGSFVNVIGTGLADSLSVNIAPQIVSLNGGEDTVTGTAAEFADDLIRGWSDNDRLVIDGIEADDLTFSFVEGGVEVGIDANANGAPEQSFTIFGDFTQTTFLATETGTGVVLRTNGTPPAPPVIEEGTDLPERFFGNTGADRIDGGGGNDTIAGDEGADTILGGDGDDDVLGSIGSDRIEGGAGDDRLSGNDDGDLILGGSGDDTLDGGTGADILYGEDGDDSILGGDAADTIGGGSGSDTIDGGDGADMIGGGTGVDSVLAGAGADTIGGGDGNDFIVGEGGDDVIAGGAGNDELDGEYGDDVVAGSFGSDRVFGGRGHDDLGGGTGRDTLFGGLGDDTMGAGEGDDVLDGGDGDDFVAGGGRSDDLSGGDGNDRLNGGSGNDTLTGGEGNDVFVWNGVEAGATDIITDFEIGADMVLIANASGRSAVSFSETVLGGATYGLAEIDGQKILFEGLSEADLSLAVFDFA